MHRNSDHKWAHVSNMFMLSVLLVGWLEFNVPFQHKYGYIRYDDITDLLQLLQVLERQNDNRMA